MRYVFIINPVAGKGKGPETIIPEIKSFFEGKEQCAIYVTTYQGEAKEIARTEAESGDEIRMFACGGEGTCFETLSGIIGYNNVSLGVIPCGSANDFLKFFGKKEYFFDIADQYEGVTIPIDLIKADEHYCINACSAGMDAVVADNMHIFKRWPLVSGSMAYKLAVVKTILGKLGMRFKITVDDSKVFFKDCLFVLCANGPVYGGGFKSAPNANPYDGKLDYAVVETISKLKIVRFLKNYENGDYAHFDFCTLDNCQSIEIEANKPFPVNLDGEIVHKSKVRFEIVKNGINFILPKKLADKMLINI